MATIAEIAKVNSNGKSPLDAQVQDATTKATLRLERIQTSRLEVPIVGIAPLIMHAWSEKARNQMMQTETVRKKREPRDPDGDFEAGRYRFPDGRDGVPAVSFKAAMVAAARFFDGATMTALKQYLFVLGEGPQQLVPLTFDSVSRREDMVRVGNGVADIRWRPQYDNWSAVLYVDFVSSAITPSSVLALVDAAGIGGVGEWRPSAPKGATGSYGRFRVADEKDVQLIVPGTH